MLATLTGCYESSEPLLTRAEFQPRWAAASCARRVRCRLGGGTCHPASVPVSSVIGDREVFDPRLAAECLAVWEREGCEPLTSEEGVRCRAAIEGTVPEGGACSVDFECPSTHSCEGSTGSIDDICRGTCEPLPGEGEPCDPVFGRCLGGLYCSPPSLCSDCEHTCERPAAAGEACDDRFCQAETTCDPVLGVCYPSTEAEGRPCDPTRNGCPSYYECTDRRCTYRGATAAPGEACEESGECPNGYVCVDAICQALGRVGDRCNEALPCLAANCVDGVCRRSAVGEPCTESFECEGGYCGEGVCAASLSEGSACERDEQCGRHPFICVEGTCVNRWPECE